MPRPGRVAAHTAPPTPPRRVTALAALVLAVFLPVLAARGQPATKTPRIGFLAQGTERQTAANLKAFREGLRDLGYGERRNYILEVRYADGRSDRLPALAAELVTLPVEAIVAPSTPAALAAMKATRTIPIVMVAVADPVGSGLVETLSRPAGNVTGVALALDEVSYKWLEFLKSVRGRLAHVAVLQNSTNRSMPAMLGPLTTSAATLNVTLKLHDVTTSEAIERVFKTIAADRPDGLVVLPDALLQGQRVKLLEHIARVRVPAIFAQRQEVLAGGLMSYGPDFSESYRRASFYVDKLLNGVSAGDLPVERPKKFELLINMKTAKALGVTIPSALRVQADQIIE